MVAKAQDFQYSYDQNGNRIVRQVINMNSKINNPDTTQETKEDSVAMINTNGENNNGPNGTATNDAANTTNQNYESMLGDQKITIYPNPTQGNITMEITNLPSESTGMITLTDLTGRQIYQSNTIKSSNNINFTNFANGNYVMKAIINGSSKEWVIVKQ